jgi:predicted branched-subunit amino acid permease
MDTQDQRKWAYDYGTLHGARRAGAWAALGTPALVLGSSYVGFGAFAREAGLGLLQSMGSTVTGWALPGQIALVEIFALGGSLIAAAIAVGLANARLLPMVVVLLPILRQGDAGRKPRFIHYVAAHFIAFTGWANAMQRCPDMPPPQRLPYYFGFTLVLWLTTIAATGLGFFLVGVLPLAVTLGLVFLNPLYFMLLFIGDLARKDRGVALIIGAITGPILHHVSPDWGLLVTGVVGGSIAFMIVERGRR